MKEGGRGAWGVEQGIDILLISKFIITIFKRIIKNMQYNMFSPNMLQLNTLPTFTNTFLPTIAFIYPTHNISSLVDFQYNCNQPFQQIPVLYHSETYPQADLDTTASQKSQSTKNKIKKTRSRNEKKELESAKKNSESNLVNQLYSYFSNYQKSQRVVQKAIKGLKIQLSQIQKIKSIFYNTVRLINFKRGRKYVNKESILAYYLPENCMLNIEGIAQHLNQAKFNIHDFCYIFRLSTHHFFKEVSLNAVLTSKRISSVARSEHLKRRRRVLQSLYEHQPQ